MRSGARQMAVGPNHRRGVRRGHRQQGVGRYRSQRDGLADEVRAFAPTVDFFIPNDVCFALRAIKPSRISI